MSWPIELTLPYPISGNRYIGERVVPGKKPFVIHYLTAEAKEFKAECQRIAKRAGVQPILGPVEYEFELYPHLPLDWKKRAKLDPVWWDMTVQCLDLDNARKVLLDALNGVAWTDDSRIRKDPGEIMMPDGESRCVIRVKPYERAHPQVMMFERMVHMPPPVRSEPLEAKPF